MPKVIILGVTATKDGDSMAEDLDGVISMKTGSCFFSINKLSTYTPDITILKIIIRLYERKTDNQPCILLKTLVKSVP